VKLSPAACRATKDQLPHRSQTWLRPPDSPARSRHLRARRKSTGQRYDDFDFDDRPPTHKQFGYAVSLGVEIEDGMTLDEMSEAIDDALHGIDGGR
jgi:hypothetical protein